MDKAKSLSYLKEEKARLNTFNQWPHAFISPRILAKIGFFYVGPYDQVKCYFCNVQVNSWEIGDVEMEEHFKWSKNCPIINELHTSNEPMEPISELKALLAQVEKFKVNCREGAYVETPFKIKLGDKDCFPFFSMEANRLETFKKWPKSNKPSPRRLSEAGFFYTQKEDRVICFSCGGGLCEWNVEDDPWEQHVLHFNCCNYLKKKTKGSTYIIKKKFSE